MSALKDSLFYEINSRFKDIKNVTYDFIEFEHIDPETNEESLVGFKIDRYHIYD